MDQQYYIIKLDNVIKGNYVEADMFLDGILNNAKFPILAKKTQYKGIYRDLITNELIIDITIYNKEECLHCYDTRLVDARYCKFFLAKLDKNALNRYQLAIKAIKKYTIREIKIEKQIAMYTKKAERYINSFNDSNKRKY